MKSIPPWTLSVAATAVALITAWIVWGYVRPWRPSQTIHVSLDQSPEAKVPGRGELFAIDPIAGLRSARNVEAELSMAGMNAPTAERVKRRSNNMGFIRSDDLPESLTEPRIIVLGDSHTMGVVGTEDNVGPVLERLLRMDNATPDALVLNAGCAFYSLYQYALRARTLVPEFTPRVLLVVVFIGNDFLDLERQVWPYLTDTLEESAANPNPPPERTSARRDALELSGDYRLQYAFWQGLNQAAYLYRNPERLDFIHRKAQRSLELIQETAEAHGTELLFALLPSFDLVFPDLLVTTSEPLREIIESGVQLDLHSWFADELEQRKIEYVDLLPVFQADGHLDLYAVDCHIWKRGHKLLAESVLEPIQRLLSR